jgi:hypothetical protein
MMLPKSLLSVSMQIKILLRNRLTLSLLIAIPAVFLGAVYLTSGLSDVDFKLAYINKIIKVKELDLNLIFMAAALVGFLASFYALVLVQKNRQTYRRLLLCGFALPNLLVSYFITQAIVNAILAAYLTGVLSFFFGLNNFFGVFSGLFLMGVVYASYATLVASLVSGYLEGILLIVLLANIDAGWLQNPLFYAGAENQAIIRYLPGFYPSQATLIKAFTNFENYTPVTRSVAYAGIFMIASLIAYFLQFTPKRTRN